MPKTLFPVFAFHLIPNNLFPVFAFHLNSLQTKEVTLHIGEDGTRVNSWYNCYYFYLDMTEPKQDDGTAIRVLPLTWNVGNCSKGVLDERALPKMRTLKNLEVAPKLVFIGFQEVDASMHKSFSLRWGNSAWSLRLMEQNTLWLAPK